MDTKSWQVGDVSITCIIEQKMERQPEFGYRNLSTQQILEQAWLKPNFATPDGKLISCIQAFVIESQNKRIIVDTCVGNDKPRRGNPAWNMLQSSFLEDLTAAGFERESIDVVLCTHLHIDHVGWNTMLVDGRWMPTFPNAQYLFGRTEWEHWSQETADAIAGDVKWISLKPSWTLRRSTRIQSARLSKPTCTNWWRWIIRSLRTFDWNRRPGTRRAMSA
jgi:hypothetical protein